MIPSFVKRRPTSPTASEPIAVDCGSHLLKQPADRVPVRFDFRDVLRQARVDLRQCGVTSSQWTVEPARPRGDHSLQVEAAAFDRDHLSTRGVLTGGMCGSAYKVECEVVTAAGARYAKALVVIVTEA